MNTVHCLPSDRRADHCRWHCTSCGWSSREFVRDDEESDHGYVEHRWSCPTRQQDQLMEALSAALGPSGCAC